MSASATSTPADRSVFDCDVQRYTELDESLKALNVQVSNIKKEYAVTGSRIMSYLQATGNKKCSTAKLSLSVSDSLTTVPLTMALVEQVARKNLKPEVATRLIDSIKLTREEGKINRTRLKRVSKRGYESPAVTN